MTCGLHFICYRKKTGTFLYTCVIRPAAIYGPGEERHLPRIVTLAKLGLCTFRIGNAAVKTDWVYVDNLVLALILASMGLLDDIPGRKGRPVAAGQPYFISDGKFLTSEPYSNGLTRTTKMELFEDMVVRNIKLTKISRGLYICPSLGYGKTWSEM